ncbi:unnamed protein product [Protopolystoma xenopodis]|uniref:Uncharacterized protein n=1 Tax=Protopolystoma xenopodis TaxID=117903 RepID=A0A3S5AEZ8_9PLAT|nr:unnamed protein product [Protopolystoma xenopodis]
MRRPDVDSKSVEEGSFLLVHINDDKFVGGLYFRFEAGIAQSSCPRMFSRISHKTGSWREAAARSGQEAGVTTM